MAHSQTLMGRHGGYKYNITREILASISHVGHLTFPQLGAACGVRDQSLAGLQGGASAHFVENGLGGWEGRWGRRRAKGAGDHPRNAQAR